MRNMVASVGMITAVLPLRPATTLRKLLKPACSIVGPSPFSGSPSMAAPKRSRPQAFVPDTFSSRPVSALPWVGRPDSPDQEAGRYAPADPLSALASWIREVVLPGAILLVELDVSNRMRYDPFYSGIELSAT